jgi:putative ABC transport system permease protein
VAACDVAILKVVGMSPRQFLAMVMTASAVLGVVIGGLVALPLGVRTYHGLMTQLAQQVGNRPPPFAFDVLHPTLYPLGAMGLAVALAGAVFPARRAARSRAAAILRSE